MENILEYNKWEDKLWALYNSIFKDASYTIRDGVIFPDKYASTPCMDYSLALKGKTR